MSAAMAALGLDMGGRFWTGSAMLQLFPQFSRLRDGIEIRNSSGFSGGSMNITTKSKEWTSEWLPAKDALARVAAKIGSPAKAKPVIAKYLLNGKLRAACEVYVTEIDTGAIPVSPPTERSTLRSRIIGTKGRMGPEITEGHWKSSFRWEADRALWDWNKGRLVVIGSGALFLQGKRWVSTPHERSITYGTRLHQRDIEELIADLEIKKLQKKRGPKTKERARLELCLLLLRLQRDNKLNSTEFPDVTIMKDEIPNLFDITQEPKNIPGPAIISQYADEIFPEFVAGRRPREK